VTTSKQAMRKMQRNATKEEAGRWRRPGIVHRKANGGNGAGGRSGELEPNGSNKREWLQPKLLPNGLAPVEAFSPDVRNPPVEWAHARIQKAKLPFA
jgi:hypothetical protein